MQRAKLAFVLVTAIDMRYPAVITIGSYEISLTIAEISIERLRIIERLAKTLALGSDTYRSGRISAEKTSILLSYIEEFKLKLKEYPTSDLVIIASSALSEAGNRYLVCEQIRRRFGIEVLLLNKNQEMAYNHLAVRGAYANFQQAAAEGLLIFEIGYGSVQLSLYTEGELCFSQNLSLGTLRLHERLRNLAKTADYADLIKEYIAGDLQHFQSFAPKKTEIKHLIVTGSSVSNRFVVSAPEEHTTLTLADCHSLEQNLLRNQDYTSLLLPTVTLIEQAILFTGVEQAILFPAVPADGVIYQLQQTGTIEQLPTTVIEEAISAAKRIAARYRTDKRHVNTVVRLALCIFDQLKSLHRLTDHDRLLLEISCNLHNIGKYFSMHDDQDISFALLQAMELSGLSDEDLSTIALLVRLHRGNFYTDSHYCRLKPAEQIRLTKLLSILVLANAADAGHSRKIRQIKLQRRGKYLDFKLFSGEDIALELHALKREFPILTDLYGLEVRVKQEKYDE